MRGLLKVLVGFLVLAAVAGALGSVAKRQLSRDGDPEADEFDIVNILDGTEFVSRAGALRGGSVRNYFGGAEIDLRGAQLASGGAHLEVETRWGGTRLLVSPSWRVELLGLPQAGAHEVDVEPPLAPDAPLLSIEARTAFGALEVTNRD
jgi:hypothetical protein